MRIVAMGSEKPGVGDVPNPGRPALAPSVVDRHLGGGMDQPALVSRPTCPDLCLTKGNSAFKPEWIVANPKGSGRRPRHPNKHIEAAIRYAESLGWRVERSKGHPWGYVLCPFSTREGCRVGVWSTPKHPESHARQIIRDVELCPHRAMIHEND